MGPVLAPSLILSIDIPFSSADASTGEGYPDSGAPPPLNIPLPDRRACVLAAANAAANWARARRATWGELPVVVPTPARIPPPPPLDNAVAEALMSALTLEGGMADAPVAQTSADSDKQPPVLALEATEAEAPPPVPVPELFAVSEPASRTVPVDAPVVGTSAPPASLDFAAADAFAPFLARETAREPFASAETLDLATVDSDAFAPLLAQESVAAEVPARTFLHVHSHDALAAPSELEATTAPDADVETPAGSEAAEFFEEAGPGTAVLWARGLTRVVLPWWPQVAMVAVLLVVGATARVYWPKLTAPKPGIAVLESVPDGSQVVVDGKALGTTPLTATLPAGSHTVEFQFRKATRTVKVDVTAGGRTVERVDWTRKPSGRLQVHTDPPGAKVSIDGVERGVTPLTLDDLNVGPHALVLERANGSIERSVTVNEKEITRVNEMIFPGWITVYSPFNLNITEGSRPIRLDDRNQVMLPSGPHELRFENRALGYEEVRRVDVRSGAVASLSIVPPRSSLTVTSSVPAEIWLDGVSAGQAPVNALPVELGTREVVVRTPDGDTRRFTVTVTTKPVTLDANFSKPAP